MAGSTFPELWGRNQSALKATNKLEAMRQLVAGEARAWQKNFGNVKATG